MTVFILDLDWIFDKSEIPNIDCMRLSSFHKQRKDKVYFVNDLSELTMLYDKLYVFANNDSIPALGSKILNDKRTMLFGKRFELCGAKQLGAVICGCRPDYLLYDTNEKNSSYAKANFVTFFADTGDKIVSRQPWKNTKKGIKRTIVTDSIFWEQTEQDILCCLEELADEINVVFLNSISLKTLIENEKIQHKFLQLHFSKGTHFKWRNNLPQTEESTKKIVNFIRKLKQHTSSAVAPIPIQAHIEGCTWQEDLKRIIVLVAIYKTHQVNYIIKGGDGHYIYEWCKKWSTAGSHNSFIEEMVFFVAAKNGHRWFEIINDKKHWKDARVRFIITLLSQDNWKSLLPQMSVQWGNNMIDISKIDFNYINKEAYLLI